MKKILFMIGVVVASMQATTAQAQAFMGTGRANDDKMIFNHLSVGVGVGSDGWGLEVAAPLTPYVSVRTGFSSLPTIKFNVNDVTIHKNNGTKVSDYADVNFKLFQKMTNWKLLFDVHPFKTSSFRVTLGAYIGGDELAFAELDEPLPTHAHDYIRIGDERVIIKSDGYTDAKVKVNNFKPYVGIGFGRAVKSTPGLNFNFDLGVQFWGKPKLHGWTLDDFGTEVYKELDYGSTDNDDAKKAAKWVSKLKVWPTINFRLTYTIF